MEIIQKYSPYICLIIFTLTTIIICNFINHNLKQKINLIEKEIDTFRQDTKSNFKKINEKIDKLINQNKESE
ncbi:hypothetical protein [Candidatus Phytoplasma solani]|uniref:Uncharacterized protein n=1 Tax=Candidatus Phytoplasma solani TaxID=69896 RepID=A0A421NUR8_9MOLU|nr:hypothetical protein [Candidatus Phytoplasma solani]RMI87654.1 hypothetical protein PSSA1_v1c6620 [Candidatus Phytoplasma solani]